MMKGRFAALIIVGIAVASLGLSPTLAGAGGFASDLLAAHNHERQRLGIPGLKWSDRLAAQAQGWADSLADRGAFEHSQDRSGAGENLWMGTTGRYGAEDMIGAFIDEQRDFHPGRFPDISRTGNWSDVGHYSQLIWPGTRQVGCAIARGRGNDVLVCRYWPAGNVWGQQVP
jgi:uncharacterized protein YkwD